LDRCEFRHRRYEPVAPPRHGFDIAGLAGVIVQYVAQSVDRFVERLIEIDKRILGPDPFFQLFTGDDFAGALD
jgi:hypothetical protein